jgi:hypothetical protein
MWLAAIGLLVSLLSSNQSASGRPLPFTGNGWELRGDRTRLAKVDGRDVLEVETGFAYRPDVRLQDGTIDFDVQVTRRRSFVYAYFRQVADGEREEFYLRPHKSSLPDAVQYAPVWQDSSTWQLHHGPGGTAAVEFDPGVWTHVRIVVQGSRAALFVKNMTMPVLVVPQLSREPQAGSIALGGFLPANVPGEGPIARFSNVVIREGNVPFDLEGAAKSVPNPAVSATGVIRAWSVSQSLVPDEAEVPSLPASNVLGAFERVEAEPSGLVQLDRHVRVPGDRKVSAALARVRVRAAQSGLYTFDLGFSDVAVVFLNGRPVFRGDGTYSFDRPRREGLIGFDNARLYLPLNAGDNDLAILVSDTFGGWGVMGRFTSVNGLTIETP